MATTRSRGRLADPLPEAKPRPDAYTGLLAVSLVGMIAGCIFLYMDYSNYEAKPPTPQTKAAAPAAAPAAGTGAAASPPVTNPPAGDAAKPPM
ncbi:MAG: hypothetical protein ACJ8FY_20925 [Gemmataceae bacterium]